MAVSAHPHLMFQNGLALDALHYYEEAFGDGFTIDELALYTEGGPGPAGQVQLAICTLLGGRLSCIDSPMSHGFDMTPAVSLFVECADQADLDHLFTALSTDGKVFMPLDNYGFSQRYGWVEDRFGVSWQLNLA